MLSTPEAIQRFQMLYGAEWSLFIHSEMWQAAKALLMEHGPNSELPKSSPLEILQFGAVFAANAQGWQACIACMEEAMANKLPAAGLEHGPTYSDSDVTLGEPAVPPTPPPVHIQTPKKRRKP